MASPNNPLKLPFFALCGLIGVFVLLVGLVSAAWVLVAGGFALICGCAAIVRIIRQGRNPRWMRSPLDGRWPRPLD